MQPMIDLHPNGMVLRAGIPGNPKLKNWLDVYMDYLVAEGIDVDNTQLSIYLPSEGNWAPFKATKTAEKWQYTEKPLSEQDTAINNTNP